MRFSYAMLPDLPLRDSVEAIRLADELGYYAVYAADETWHKDMWLLFAAAADKTRDIRLGPCLSPVTLREPTLIAQAAATLDELTGGRAECVISSGNFGLLTQYGIEWARTKPLSRVAEAHQVMRTFLDQGSITHHGEHFHYDGLFTFARPVQQPLPLKLGAMRGPRSFQVAGEISDGVHHALSYSLPAYEYMVENVRIGAERAGRDWRTLDLGAWVVFAVGHDGEAAKQAARAMVGLYASSMSAEQLARNGVEPDSLRDIVAAVDPATCAAPMSSLPRTWPGSCPSRARRRSASTRSSARSSPPASTTSSSPSPTPSWSASCPDWNCPACSTCGSSCAWSTTR
jgi:5,10-methylenetetrahydromethanopterin reductase